MQMMSFMIPEPDAQELKAIARELGLSVSAAIRRAVEREYGLGRSLPALRRQTHRKEKHRESTRA